MINFNKKLKPINRKELEAKFEKIKEEKKKMDERNYVPRHTPIVGR